MSDEFVDARWARDAVNQVERAMLDWNQEHASSVPIRVVWGHANKEDADEERKLPKSYQHQHGLINWLSLDFDLLISKHGDSDHPNLCRIETRFAELQPLPLTRGQLANKDFRGTHRHLLRSHASGFDTNSRGPATFQVKRCERAH